MDPTVIAAGVDLISLSRLEIQDDHMILAVIPTEPHQSRSIRGPLWAPGPLRIGWVGKSGQPGCGCIDQEEMVFAILPDHQGDFSLGSKRVACSTGRLGAWPSRWLIGRTWRECAGFC